VSGKHIASPYWLITVEPSMLSAKNSTKQGADAKIRVIPWEALLANSKLQMANRQVLLLTICY